MEILPVKTRKFLPPQDDLFEILEQYLPALQEGDIVCIASKVVAIHQGRIVQSVKCKVQSFEKTKNKKQKDGDAPLPPQVDKGGWGDLDGDHQRRGIILSEADWVNDAEKPFLTIKNGQFIPFAGVDESNGDGHYILWPEDPMGVAAEIRVKLRGESGVRDLGIVITDSTCLPLRNGTVGTAIGFAGIEPVKDYRGTKDLFDRMMELSRVNVADGLAAAAVLVMGEGSESTPVAIIRGAEGIVFTDVDDSTDVRIDPSEDVFAPVLSAVIPTSPPLPTIPRDWPGDRPFFTLIAVSSLDGVIAREGLGVEEWASSEDQQWFHALLPTFDATVLGRSTYEQLPEGVSDRDRVVLTSTVDGLKQLDAHTWFLDPAKVDLIAFLREKGWKNVGVTGGGETYSFFLAQGWADRLLLTVEPLAFGDGTRLFSGAARERFRLTRTTRLNAEGTVLYQYDRMIMKP